MSLKDIDELVKCPLSWKKNNFRVFGCNKDIHMKRALVDFAKLKD